MRLPGETSQQDQLPQQVQEHTQISPPLQLSPACCSLCSPGQTHQCTSHTQPWGQAPLTVTSKDACILKLSLLEVSPHSHADTALCLNKQVAKYSMSTILTDLIPQEFNTVVGGLYWWRKKYGYGNNWQFIDRRKKFSAKLNILLAQSPLNLYLKFC